MKLRILLAALRLVLSRIDPQMVKEIIDDMLDKVEDRYAENQLIMSGVQLARDTFSIPDDIGGDED